ncbi:hypothetical protein ACXZ65_09230 [Streptomyces aculeolatus]
MERTDLSALAAAALSAAAPGGADTPVSAFVRDRLSRSARGQAALAGVVAAPDDPGAAARVRALLAEEIGGDREFADRLSALLQAALQQQPGTVSVTGSKVTRSQITFGPLTVNNTRAGRLSLGTGFVLAVLMVALAVYGGVRFIDGPDDSPRGELSPSEPGAAPSGGPAPLPPTTDTIRRVLPDRDSMDARGYPWMGTPEVTESAAGLPLCRAAPECVEDVAALGAVEFGRGANEGENIAEFLVMAYPDADAAHRAYVDIVQDLAEVDPRFIEVGLARRGDESQGFDQDGTDTARNRGEQFVNRSLIFRQGAFIGVAHQMDDPTAQRMTRIHALSGILADRLAKADAGEVP